MEGLDVLLVMGEYWECVKRYSAYKEAENWFRNVFHGFVNVVNAI